MKIIEPSAAYRTYKKYQAPVAAHTEAGGQQQSAVKQAAQKTDQIDFSAKAARSEELGKLTQNIASELATGVSSTRMQELKTAVENGEYYLPTAQLADSMLDVFG